MPRGDRMGPYGMGPMTGRADGFYIGYAMPGHANPVEGRGSMYGWGGGFSRGRGYRHWYNATGLPGWARAGYYPAWGAIPFAAAPTPEQEESLLRAQAQHLKAALADVEQRLRDLKPNEGGQPGA